MSQAMWWWLCFTDDKKPEGEQFLGVTIVLAPTLEIAIKVASSRGANPGGEVHANIVPLEWDNPPPTMAASLLTRREADDLTRVWDPQKRGLATPERVAVEDFIDVEALKNPAFGRRGVGGAFDGRPPGKRR